MIAEAVADPVAGFHAFEFSLRTSHAREFIDLTDRLRVAVAESGVDNGLLVVSSLHTTASIVVNEHEPELLRDLDTFLAGIAPDHNGYAHNTVPCLPGEKPNGHAHCQALLLAASATIPIVQGRLALGQWQRVFFVELDHARPRRVAVSVVGA